MLTDFDEGSGDEGEAMTATEVLEKLEEAWLNEKFSPELLENRADIVDCMLEQVHEMEENIRRAKKGDFKVSIHKMEIDRIRYVLSSYLRSRIKKIENNASHCLEEDGNSADEPKLTPEEMQYAQEYKENLEGHFNSLALRHMPPNLRNLDPKQTTMRPDLNSYVFLRVNRDVEGVVVEEESSDNREEIVDLEKGDQHIMRYQPIKGLVSKGDVQLI